MSFVRRVDGLEFLDNHHDTISDEHVQPGRGQHLDQGDAADGAAEHLLHHVPVLGPLHGGRPSGVLQYQVQARLQVLPTESQYVYTWTSVKMNVVHELVHKTVSFNTPKPFLSQI